MKRSLKELGETYGFPFYVRYMSHTGYILDPILRVEKVNADLSKVGGKEREIVHYYNEVTGEFDGYDELYINEDNFVFLGPAVRQPAILKLARG